MGVLLLCISQMKKWILRRGLPKVTAKLRFQTRPVSCQCPPPLPLVLAITAYMPIELGPAQQGGGQTMLGQSGGPGYWLMQESGYSNSIESSLLLCREGGLPEVVTQRLCMEVVRCGEGVESVPCVSRVPRDPREHLLSGCVTWDGPLLHSEPQLPHP